MLDLDQTISEISEVKRLFQWNIIHYFNHQIISRGVHLHLNNYQLNCIVLAPLSRLNISKTYGLTRLKYTNVSAKQWCLPLSDSRPWRSCGRRLSATRRARRRRSAASLVARPRLRQTTTAPPSAASWCTCPTYVCSGTVLLFLVVLSFYGITWTMLSDFIVLLLFWSYRSNHHEI